jgi:hypothetical protein
METPSEYKFEYMGDEYVAHLSHIEDPDGAPHVEIDHIEDIYGSHIEPSDDDEFGNELYQFFWENYSGS